VAGVPSSRSPKQQESAAGASLSPAHRGLGLRLRVKTSVHSVRRGSGDGCPALNAQTVSFSASSAARSYQTGG
jgi:hypothetical protein